MAAQVDPTRTIMLPDPGVAFCARHLEPLRATWPRAYIFLMVATWDAVAQDERFQSRMPDSDDEPGRKRLDVELANRTLIDISPLCCWLGDDLAAALVQAALVRMREGRPRS